MPRISVIIPTYQSVQFVRGAIDSVLRQTYRDYEVIVVDGGSTDGTLAVLNSYGNRIRVISQNGRGISNALNNGIAASNGEYITRLDSDDLWVTNKLEVQCKFLQSRSDRVGLVYSNVLFFEERNGKLRTSRMEKLYRGRVIKHLLATNFIPASTVMIRKSCFEKLGYFDESLEVCEDIDMWIRIAASFDIDYQDLALAEIRWHPSSVLHRDPERHFRSIIALQNKTMPYLLKEARSKSFHKTFYSPYLTFGIDYLLKKETRNAKQKLRQYIKLCPYNINAYFLLLLTLIPSDMSSRLMQEEHIPKSLGLLLTKLSR